MAFPNQCRGLVCGALLAHNCWPRSNSTAMIGTPKKKAARYRAASDGTVCRLGDHRFALLLLCAFGSPRLCRKLQYGCLLAWGQAGEQDNLPIRELKRIAVGRRFFVELPEDRRLVLRRYPHRKPLLIRDRTVQSAYRTSLANASSVPGRTQTAVVRSATEAKPRVPVPKSLVTSLSPIFAGRVRTLCKL